MGSRTASGVTGPDGGELSSPDIRAAWGKAKSENVPHPLMCHMLDTAAVAELLYGVLLGPRCREELEAGLGPLGDATAWVAVLCGLHDLGKFSPGFQSLRTDLAVDLLGDMAAADLQRVTPVKGAGRTDTPHGSLTGMHLEEMLRSWGATESASRRLASVLAGHHGYFQNGETKRKARNAINDHGREKWATWRTGMVREFARLWRLPDPTSLPWDQVRIELAAAVGLAGLISVSDWIASSTEKFGYAGADVDLIDYVETARKLARKAAEELDWVPWHPPTDTSFVSLFRVEPRPVQQAVEMLAKEQDRPSILVIEAPTGEGKTNAALQWSATLVRHLDLAGLYIGMPTKATSNQARKEVQKFLKGQAVDLRARLLHSSAAEHLADIGRDESDNDGVEVASDWLTRRWDLLASVGVGTVDQALKGALRSRWVFVTLTALSGKVLVIDEVHAYDTYMSTLLDRLLWWMGRLGVSVVLLSATLPSGRREELVRAWSAGATGCTSDEVPPVPTAMEYPRLTWSDGREHRVPVVPAPRVSPLNTKRKARMEKLGMDGAAEWALEQVKNGGCAVVIHNLVRRVNDTHDQLRKMIKKLPRGERPKLIVLTAQLPGKVRRKREENLREFFGPSSAHRPRAIVIGTQVLEQSLDLDFDAMASDLAPMDSLIQRMGRLWRHRFIDDDNPPVLAITGVEDEVNGPRLPRYAISVYQEILLLRTWALLRNQHELTSPESVPELVDCVYGADEAISCPAGWERRWETGIRKRNAALKNDNHAARKLYLPQASPHLRLSELTVRPTSSSQTRKSRGQGR
ncbi:CRISPR-associated helicase Cas3' [Amycolatopsis taiwanensis]|uniref:CRISPR-associated helicase Cas3' n=1 Tax=Amycolatopsis taiwanensis TaxID=342230 RepID=UPI0004B22EC9|nr:CRISPR-associated helicase Cas3' [Amycolatopsis taiwanensis]